MEFVTVSLVCDMPTVTLYNVVHFASTPTNYLSRHATMQCLLYIETINEAKMSLDVVKYSPNYVPHFLEHH